MPSSLLDPNATPNLHLSYGVDQVINSNLNKVDRSWYDLITAINDAFQPGSPIQLPPNGVTPGSFGDSAHAVTVTVDATGRVTAITQVAISVSDANITNISYTKITGAPTTLPPSGPAGGDLTGSSYPNPVIAPLAVNNAKINDVAWGKVTGAPAIVPLPVSRANLAPNAPCGTAVYAAVPTGQNYTGPIGWTTVCSVTLATRGGCVLLFAAPSMAGVGSAGGTNISLRFLFDSARQVTASSQLVNVPGPGNTAIGSLAWVDAGPSGTGVPAGTHTYAFQINLDNTGNVLTSNVAGGGIVAMEVG